MAVRLSTGFCSPAALLQYRPAPSTEEGVSCFHYASRRVFQPQRLNNTAGNISLKPSLSSSRFHCLIRCSQEGKEASLSPSVWKQSRRVISLSFLLSRFLLLPNDAMASSLIDKYVKRKKLDPLEAYVPPVILAQLQIQDLEKFLNVEKPEFEACRSVLRSGPASSLRVNIRAVAQYASDAGYSETATKDVDRCLRALEEMDSLFLRASRKDPNATVVLMKSQLGTALTALDSLLQTVPSEVLDKGKAMVEVYRSPVEDDNVSDSSEIQQLQSIL